jgi:hypothetical protein
LTAVVVDAPIAASRLDGIHFWDAKEFTLV